MTFPSSLPPDSSSSSLPSPSPPFRPFSRLPTELVQHIIESTVPLHYHSTSYRDRQTTLRSLCLVSRLFRQIAQPRLFTVAQLESRTSGGLWPKPEERKLISLRRFLDATIEPPPVKVEAFLPSPYRQSLALLVITKTEFTIDMSLMASLVNLTTVRLTDVEIISSVRYELTRLRELQLWAVKSDRAVDAILNSTTLPSLRSLSLGEQAFERKGYLSMLNGLTPQVNVISLDQGAVRHIGFHDLSEEPWSKIMNNALFDTNIYDYLPHVRNIRIFIPGSPTPRHAHIKHIDYIRTLIRDMVIPLPDLLYVPPFAPGVLENMTGAQDVALQLARVCEARGVELVYEEQRHDWTRDSVFSRNFSRRTREREEAAKQKGPEQEEGDRRYEARRIEVEKFRV